MSDHKDLRPLISACRRCPNVLAAPRFGTGPVAGVKLMIVGQNPPQDPARCLHGAWMLHYPRGDARREGHEDTMLALVDYLGLDPMKDVYTTNQTKCPTNGNKLPYGSCVQTCIEQFLRTEVKLVNPEVLLVLGTQAHVMVREHLWDQASYLGAVMNGLRDRRNYFKVQTTSEIEYAYTTTQYANVVQAAHPSCAGRFVQRESWMNSIKQAIALARIERPLKVRS